MEERQCDYCSVEESHDEAELHPHWEIKRFDSHSDHVFCSRECYEKFSAALEQAYREQHQPPDYINGDSVKRVHIWTHAHLIQGEKETKEEYYARIDAFIASRQLMIEEYRIQESIAHVKRAEVAMTMDADKVRELRAKSGKKPKVIRADAKSPLEHAAELYAKALEIPIEEARALIMAKRAKPTEETTI